MQEGESMIVDSDVYQFLLNLILEMVDFSQLDEYELALLNKALEDRVL